MQDELRMVSDAKGRIQIDDRAAGKLWGGDGHALQLRYCDTQTQSVVELSACEWDHCRVTTLKRERHAVHHRYLFPHIGIGFEIEYALSGDSVRLRLPIASLREENSRYRAMSATPLPRFGRVANGEPGYLVLPNYCGSICRFNGEREHTQRSMFYGCGSDDQPNPTVMPIYGVVHGRAAMLGIVEDGKFDAQLIAEANRAGYYAAYVQFCFRDEPDDRIDDVDRALRLCFVGGEQAGYVGLAKRYRDYLLQDVGLEPLKQRVENNRVLRYYCESYSDFRVGLGKKLCAGPGTENDGDGTFQACRKFEHVKRVLTTLASEGIEKATIILVGWTQEGADGLYPTKFPADERLGGDIKLRDLVTFAQSMDYQIVSWDNYTDCYRRSPDFSACDVIKTADGSLYTPGWYWAGGLAYKICPEIGLEHALRSLPIIKDRYGFAGVYLTDAMPLALVKCHEAVHGHAATRRSMAEGYRRIASSVRQMMGGCHVENAHDYMADSCDAISRIPTQVAPGGRPGHKRFYDCFLGERVPFYQIAYHGIIQYHLYPPYDCDHALLNELQYGAKPRFEMHFPADRDDDVSLATWLPVIKQQYNLLCRDFGYLQYEFIDNHRLLDRNVSETTYTDQTIVIVNYGDGDYATADGVVPAKGYLIAGPQGKADHAMAVTVGCQVEPSPTDQPSASAV